MRVSTCREGMVSTGREGMVSTGREGDGVYR